MYFLNIWDVRIGVQFLSVDACIVSQPNHGYVLFSVCMSGPGDSAAPVHESSSLLSTLHHSTAQCMDVNAKLMCVFFLFGSYCLGLL